MGYLGEKLWETSFSWDAGNGTPGRQGYVFMVTGENDESLGSE